MDCAICCETYKTESKIVTCPNPDCRFKACRSCNQTYLESKNAMDPHCMNCNVAWNQHFVVINLTRVWFKDRYTPIRNRVNIETEMSKLPESMHRAAAIKLDRKRKKDLAEAIRECKRVQTLLKTCQNQDDKYEYTERLKILNEKLDRAREHAHTSQDTSKKKEKKFIMACVFEDCKGFLNKDHYCELCERTTCKRCLHGITGEHTCNKDDIETANEIKKTTRPCPSCGERIFKISGCDQMYCTQCHTAFSWQTGAVQTGNIHNPHYFQLRRQNNGAVPRNPNDVLCGGHPHFGGFAVNIAGLAVGILRHYLDPGLYQDKSAEWRNDVCDNVSTRFMLLDNHISSIHQIIGHISGVNLYWARIKSRDLSSCRSIHVDYLTDDIGKSAFNQLVSKTYNDKRKNDALLQLYELFSVVGVEFLRDIYETTAEVVDVSSVTINAYFERINTKINEFHRLIKYINYQFKIVSVSYNCSVLQIVLPVSMPFVYTNGCDNGVMIKLTTATRKVTKEWSVTERINWSDAVNKWPLTENIMRIQDNRLFSGYLPYGLRDVYRNIRDDSCKYRYNRFRSHRATMREVNAANTI